MNDGGGTTGGGGFPGGHAGGGFGGQPGGQPAEPGGAPVAYLPPVTSATPDWAALAAANEQEHRRKRLLRIGGGVLGVLVVGGLVATALAVAGPGGDRRPEARASASGMAPTGGTPADGTAPASPSEQASPSAGAAASGSPSASPSSAGGTVAPGGKATPGAGGKPSGAVPGAPAGPAQLAAQAGGQAALLGPKTTVGPTDGHTGPTLVLGSSADGYAQTSAPVVDTNRSFTVSAMVRNNAPTGGRAVVTQGDGSYYSFYLGRDYWDSHNQWVFKVQTAAGAQDNTTYQAFSPGNATTGQWTLLTGVYDAGSKKIQLYVDGQLAQTTPVTGIWQTGGPLQIGRVRYKSAWTDFWDGAIGDVQVWDRALPADAVNRLKGTGGTSAGVSPTAAWLLP
ncbi:LamG domain-containing protein [Kitasatospora sp. NPDC088346]|uniref:LamG domain-containing protein n=1 Tax=Kitasatospora sp. NPDC088346 TaxID=3364073 RepID=UPI0038281D5C